MDVKCAVELRRSIRSFEARAVSDEIITDILEAARLAPSGCNVQPWRFALIKDAATMQRLQKQGAFQQDFVYHAPLVVVCCGDPRGYAGEYGGGYQVEEGSVPADPAERKAMFSGVAGKEDLRAVRDVAIASGFLVLRATELGLGTCYVGLINAAVLKEVLAIADEYVIPFVIAVGYGTTQPRMRPRKELKDVMVDQPPARK